MKASLPRLPDNSGDVVCSRMQGFLQHLLMRLSVLSVFPVSVCAALLSGMDVGTRVTSSQVDEGLMPSLSSVITKHLQIKDVDGVLLCECRRALRFCHGYTGLMTVEGRRFPARP